MKKRAIIIGAGPAGLTAAYELLKRTDIQPILFEKSGDIGGISKTVNYKGNRIDIGGHRFFSKSDRVMDWWQQFMPLHEQDVADISIHYQNQSRPLIRKKTGDERPPSALAGMGDPQVLEAATPQDPDRVMLLRRRLSRIYFLRRFFNYPIKLSADTLRKLGFARTAGIIFSYVKARLFPRRQEKTLEDFLINRFGARLYETFFKDYTEKVWGVPCQEISAEWGAQRIKGVSISAAIAQALRSATKKSKTDDIKQKDVETSLIERFLYPKFGPGQLWEEVARQVIAMGGEIHMHMDIKAIHTEGARITSVEAVDKRSGSSSIWEGDYFFSTMPVSELIKGLRADVPADVKEIAAGLQYRDFITVGLLLKQFSAAGSSTKITLEDTWIYIQEKDVKVGRLQLFNNWSPFLVKDPSTTWVGMEYFCNEGDDFWRLTDEQIKELAITELDKIGLARREDLLDATVLRMEKTYPAYFGTYDRFDLIRNYTDNFGNLYLVGRNGMHKYNNADHSMLTAMTAVDNICAGVTDKANIWSINTEQDYHEESKKA
ncbi:MAG TPA: NAD(P)/FAD-dependent oxidoreductase [Puia sp.]|jgi:protoporphyrinogen oxidase|nr:NAD(P)/FAD-dependent oxidoreductase [Puia sp.]